MRGEETQFVAQHFLGERVLRLDRRSGRSGDTGVHQKPGAGGQPLGANEFVALIGHLQVVNEFGVALATPTAASGGPIPKAPRLCRGILTKNETSQPHAMLRRGALRQAGLFHVGTGRGVNR